MKSCCDKKDSELIALGRKQIKVLKMVLAINVIMFFIEIVTGVISRSTALLSDSLDMLGDAAVYAVSIYAVTRGDLWKIRSAKSKGYIMAFFGMAVVIEAGLKVFSGKVPEHTLMWQIGILALVANTSCLLLLYRHKSDDISMRSTWVCSRNDILANLGVLIAALGVAMTNSNIPDVLIGTLIAALFFRSAVGLIKEANFQRKLVLR